jgi:hypothetical protein
MKAKLSLIFLTQFYCTMTYAQTLTGHWEAVGCSSYNDSSSYGTYNYQFEPVGQDRKGKVSTFIQYYDDFKCTQKQMTLAPQAKGIYLVESQRADEYDLVLFYTHLNYPIYGKATFQQNKMNLCLGSRCTTYVRR